MQKNILIMFLLAIVSVSCSVKPKDPYPSTGNLHPLEMGNYWNYMSYNESSGEVIYTRKEVRDTMTVLDTVHLYKLYVGESNADFSSISWNSKQYIAKDDSFLYYYSYNDSFPHWKDMPNQIKIGDSWISDWDLQEYIVEDKDSVDVPAGVFFAYKIKVYPYYSNHSLSYYKWIAEDIGLVKEEHNTWSTVLMGYQVK
ncbi:MAG: hypothetical protein GWP03_06475 [Proteobacteria bacterium]|nr:hypothetical protein [Pseudomonadota bacterium]